MHAIRNDIFFLDHIKLQMSGRRHLRYANWQIAPHFWLCQNRHYHHLISWYTTPNHLH